MRRYAPSHCIALALAGLFVGGAALAQAPPRMMAEVLGQPEACAMPRSILAAQLAEAAAPRSSAEHFAAEPHGSAWGCYDPQPGHPTAAERLAFIERISALAVAAEARHRVPAAAIAAMALVESGAGFTRTALGANNLFGWKASARDPAGSFVLACQDTTGEVSAADPNRCYRRFASEAEAVDTVAGRLASGFHPHYAAAAVAWRDPARAGLPLAQRVQDWVAGIADPYNWRPTDYARTLCRLMRDPVAPNGALHPGRNLLRLSARPGEEVTLEHLPEAARDCASLVVPAR
jgi:hypothetical protein